MQAYIRPWVTVQLQPSGSGSGGRARECSPVVSRVIDSSSGPGKGLEDLVGALRPDEGLRVLVVRCSEPEV